MPTVHHWWVAQSNTTDIQTVDSDYESSLSRVVKTFASLMGEYVFLK
jgi:hypothetical protein